MNGSLPLRIGILGAARIAPWALVRPARRLPGVAAAAIAARDPARALRFARKHKIDRVHDSYVSLLADPELDAVYIALPNSRHHRWALAALAAGKHVLCEKPMTANAREAEELADALNGTNLVIAEAFHNLYHPLAAAMRDVIHGGALGAIQHIETRFCTYMLRTNDIRLRYELGGGATMDLGCYCIRLARYLLRAEPTVVDAHALCFVPQVDQDMEAEFVFPDSLSPVSLDARSAEITGRMICTFRARGVPSLSLRVTGSKGEMHVVNPILPHLFNWLTVRTGQGTTRRWIRGRSTYWYQLRAFRDAIHKQRPLTTDVHDAVANMRVIDAVYEKAGLKMRGT